MLCGSCLNVGDERANNTLIDVDDAMGAISYVLSD